MNKQTLVIFIKGFLMGICDVVPGISGGTIAFITGIYLRLINTINNLTPKNLIVILKTVITLNPKKINKILNDNDLYFLTTLLLGILSAIFLFSKLISYLLENYITYTLSFFIGLILPSSFIIYKEIENHKIKDKLFGIIGFLIGLSLIFFVPKEIISPNIFYVVFGGFIAISAMFLPGVSGSFLLLIMGLYKFILDSIHNLKENFEYLIAFGIGAVIGAIFISRTIVFLYKIDKSKTLYSLLGIVVGSLAIPTSEMLASAKGFNTTEVLLVIMFFSIATLLVYLISRYSKQHNKKIL